MKVVQRSLLVTKQDYKHQSVAFKKRTSTAYWEQSCKLNNWAGRLFNYFKFLDKTNAKVLETLGDLGARNMTALAKSTNLPITTVRFRLKKMMEDGRVLVSVNPNMSRLGLAKAFMISNALLGHQDRLLETIKNTGYWTYIRRCYGKFDGYCAYFAFPAGYMKELENYVNKAKSLRAFSYSQFFWITNSRVVPLNFSWYNFENKIWSFQWEQWINDALTVSSKLPDIIKEPDNYPIMVDKKDLLIIKELQKDESIEFKKLAKIVGIAPQSVGFRYHNHILPRNLIVDHAVDVCPFPVEISDRYLFIIDFGDEKSVAKFANACDKKPFVVSYAKIIGKNSLIVNIYVSKTEFPNLVKSLNRLYIEGLVKEFFYVILDPTSYRRQTISYEYFENGKWTYDSKEKIKKLKEIIRRH
jgi:DNA-binding Lrp family transcriptional regulator